ncbi:MAG: hypothetical protein M1812_007187 [Candelaria pacifica]|nr:MAG: hypothetical protein M1812_007187 [Candelaria pacifica]
MSIKLIKVPQLSQQYKNLQGSLQYHTRDSHYYKPPRANKVARELRGMSPHETSYDELNHQDVPWNRPTQEPLRGTLVADLDKNRPRCYEAVLPSIEKSAPRPNPMNVHYNPPLNQQDIRNDGKDRLPGRVGQLLPSNFQRREHSAVHIIDDNHDEHALASKRRKVEHFPLRPRDAESDPTLESNVNHMRIMRPMTPQRAHEISGTLRSPLHSGVSNIRLATPQSDRFKPVGRSTELPYMSNAYSATSTRSGVPIFPFTDTPEPLSSSRKSLHHPTHNNFPASQCAMNYVHSSLPTPPFSKELYPLRHDTQQSQHSTQIRARPAPPLWNTDRYEGRQSPDQINLEEARSIEQERLSRHVFGEPTSMVSTRPVATENRLSDGHVSGHPRSSLGSKDLSLYEKKVPPGQSTIGDGQSQGVSVSKHVHGSRFYEELPRHDGSGIVRHDPRLPTQSEGEPVYIPHQQPITSTRYETVPDHRFHRRPAPRESHLPYHENTLNDHDVIVIKEQKSVYPADPSIPINHFCCRG